MAQAQATPKFKRARNLLLASLAPSLAERSDLQPSERQALEARRRHITAPAKQVVFLIPLVRRGDIQDWPAVSARLAATINSLKSQTNPNWRAVICGQDQPEAIHFDEQVQFLPFTKPVDGNDKWDKLNALAQNLKATQTGPSFVMPFDADDLLAPTIVDEMLTRQASGYVVQAGYVLDAGTGQVALTAAQNLLQPGQKAFWKLCGSCAAFRYETAADADWIQSITAHEHRMFPYLAQLSGRALMPLSQPAALYVLNHGDNFGVRRGRVSFKSRYVERFALTDTTTFDVTFPGQRGA